MQSSATSVCIILLPFAVFSCQGVWMPWSLQLESWFPFFSFVKFLDYSLDHLWFARSQKMCYQEVRKCNIQLSEHQKECCFSWQFLWTKLFYQKLRSGPRVGKCPVLRQHKICNCPTPRTDKAGKCPALAWKGGWAQLELTDALDAANCFFFWSYWWIISRLPLEVTCNIKSLQYNHTIKYDLSIFSIFWDSGT